MREYDPYIRFSIVEPLMRLSARRNRSVMISQQDSDVARMAAEVCTAINHLPEQVADADPKLAADIRSLQGFQVCKDVSDTTKHKRLRLPERTVSLRGFLSYEFRDLGGTKYRFIRTEVYAENAIWGSIELIDHLIDLSIELFRLLSIPLSISKYPMVASESFEDKILVEQGSESFMVKQIGLRFYSRDEGGGLVLADPPEINLEVAFLQT